MRQGIPERRARGYARHGVTCLFAALEIATGTVAGACYPRHRHQEFLRFLNDHPHPFAWTKDPSEILASIQLAKTKSNALTYR